MLPATNRGSIGGPRRTRWSAAILLLSLALVLTGCISVTPPPGGTGGSPVPGASASPVTSLTPSAEPSVDAASPQALGTAEPSLTTAVPTFGGPSLEPSPTSRPTLQQPDRVSPVPGASGSPAASAPAASIAPATIAPSAAPSPSPAPATASPVPPSAVPSTAPASIAPGASPASSGKPRPTAPLLTPGPARERAVAKTEVFGFLPYWELQNADTLDLSALTTIAWFGVEVGVKGALQTQDNGRPTPGWAGWQSPEWRSLQQKAQAAGVRTVLTIERFAWTDAQRKKTVKFLADPVARMRFASEAMDAITEAGADGINLDFEPMPAESSADFTQLVRELRAAMNAVDPKLQLTFDVLPGVDNYDVAALTADDAADAMFVMAYEYLTGAASNTGSNAPLIAPDNFDITTSVTNILSQMPPDRVILGLPWYGRAWSTVSREPHAETRSGARWPSSNTINYDDAIVQAARTGRWYDDVQESAWTVYPSKVQGCNACRVTWRQLWYDDVDATRAKIQYALDQKLGGVGFWALGYQGAGSEMWSVIGLTVGGEKDRKAPTGKAELDPGYVDGKKGNLPVVGRKVRLLTTANDGPNGSGVAYVRVGMRAGVDGDGMLVEGTTFQASASVLFDILTGGPVYDLPTPKPGKPAPTVSPEPSASPSGSPVPSGEPSIFGSPAPSVVPVFSPSASGSPGPSASPEPSVEPSPEPTPADTGNLKPGKQIIHVQWRDVAGNWSDVTAITVWFKPGAALKAAPAPEPSVAPASVPPLVPGESPVPSLLPGT
ncbi:MAG: glycosyl hydrolase family 18 protein [Chloroflexota bacterium]